MTCENCGNTEARKIKIQYVDHPEDKSLEAKLRRSVKMETCDKCANMSLSPAYYRDAAGQRVTYTGDKAFSYAIGSPITSAKQLSENAKRNNLTQTGDNKRGQA